MLESFINQLIFSHFQFIWFCAAILLNKYVTSGICFTERGGDMLETVPRCVTLMQTPLATRAEVSAGKSHEAELTDLVHGYFGKRSFFLRTAFFAFGQHS